MNRRTGIVVAALVVLGALAAWAGDPWKDKPFTAWDHKDIEKVTAKSPWAQRTQIDLTRVVEKRTIYLDGDSSRPQDVKPIYNRQGGIVGYGTNAPEVEGQTYKVSCLVQWVSARTLREAVIRSSVLQGFMAEEEAGRFLSAPSSYFEISIQGPSMILAFLGPDQNQWQQAGRLKLKSTDEDIPAADISVQGQGDYVEVKYLFPRERRGQPTVPPGEEKIEFQLVGERDKMKVTFDLRKMVRDGEPDL